MHIEMSAVRQSREPSYLVQLHEGANPQLFWTVFDCSRQDCSQRKLLSRQLRTYSSPQSKSERQHTKHSFTIAEPPQFNSAVGQPFAIALSNPMPQITCEGNITISRKREMACTRRGRSHWETILILSPGFPPAETSLLACGKTLSHLSQLCDCR
jgi:hypothetical protein